MASLDDEVQHIIDQVISPAIAVVVGKAFRAGSEASEQTYRTDHSLIKTIKVNVNNDSLSDADFRQFVRNSIKD